MKRNHLDRLRRALAELDHPYDDAIDWMDVERCEAVKRQIRRASDMGGSRVP